MSLEKAIILGFGILCALLVMQQIDLTIRARRFRLNPAKAPEGLSSRESFRFGLLQCVFYGYMIAASLYYTQIGRFSLLFEIPAVVLMLIFMRKPIDLVRSNRPMFPDRVAALPVVVKATHEVDPDTICEILSEASVIDFIQKDFRKIHQIGGKEQWRLGLLTPDLDACARYYDQMPRVEQIRRGGETSGKVHLAEEIKFRRAAVVHATSSFNLQLNNVLVLHGAKPPMIRSYPGWSYALQTKTAAEEFVNIGDLRIDTSMPSAAGRSPGLRRFLQEDGFPLLDAYTDGDPLTTERGGTIVIDRNEIKVIYSNYFVQGRLIDDEGKLVYLGLDENFRPSSTWDGFPLMPSVSRKLYKSALYNDYKPVVRYRSFPYASNFMLPILDTPMSDSGWADLFIDPRGKAKLFVAKQKTLQEWYGLMEKLRQLFLGELAKKGYRLLGLTKDADHLWEYFSKKQKILEEYFTVMDWQLR